jgi:transposase-like protein
MRTKAMSMSRRRFSAGERRELLAEYHRGGLTQREFVEPHHLSLATLAKWLRWERAGALAPRRKNPPFAELPLAQVLGGSPWGAEIVRPDGWTVRLMRDTPAALVEQLLRAC